MRGKILILILFFYILALFQTSFLVHFNILGWWVGWSPNLILILVILINFFESPQENSGIFAGFFGGFFLDIFSEDFFGFWILILIIITIFIKFILKKYVHIPITERA